MKKLTATRIDHYVSRKGNITFRYVVTGEQKDLDDYKEAQGVHYKEYENDKDSSDPLIGKPLYFTTQPTAKEIELMITNGGKVIPKVDTDDVAEKVLNQEERVQMELAKLTAMARFNRNKVTAS